MDYAGHTMPVVDRETGEIRKAEIFVGTLGASNFTFAEATWTQTLPDWVGSHVRMFAYFGAVPKLVVPDNLRSGVRPAFRYDPVANPTYQEMVAHYGVGVLRHEGWRVAMHPRSHRPGKATTDPALRPKAHVEHQAFPPSRLIRQARKTGPEMAAVVTRIAEERLHPEQGYRPCLGILRLGDRFSPERL